MADFPTSTPSASVLGLEFIELVAPNLETVAPWLNGLGFTLTSVHRRKNVYLFQQANCKIIVNCSDDLSVQAYVDEYQVAIYALALRCSNAGDFHALLLERGAWDKPNISGPMEINIPGIESIGGTSLYFIDQLREDLTLYDIDFKPIKDKQTVTPKLSKVSEVRFNVEPGRGASLTIWLQRLLGLSQDSDPVQLPDGFRIALHEQEPVDDKTDFADRITFAAPATLSLDTSVIEQTAFTVEVA